MLILQIKHIRISLFLLTRILSYNVLYTIYTMYYPILNLYITCDLQLVGYLYYHYAFPANLLISLSSVYLHISPSAIYSSLSSI